jgi:pilus assembly protein Flp/PilA
LGTNDPSAGRPPFNQILKAWRNKMKNLKQLLQNLMADESGQDLIEYALVAALVGLGSIASMQGLANSIATTFTGVSNALTSAV